MSLDISQSFSCVTPKIKIKSPKKDIKVYKLNYETTKKSPEIAVPPGSINQTYNDDLDKITQAWNRLKVNALSKAIAISPEVVHCTIGPKLCTSAEPQCDETDGDCDKPDLSNAITSTPLKPKKAGKKSVDSKVNETVSDSESIEFDVSHIQLGNKENTNDNHDEISESEKLNKICLNEIEARVKLSYENKRKEREKLWLKEQERLIEKAGMLRVELDKERLLRLQKQFLESQNHITESKANVLKKMELQTKIQHDDHSKKIAEANEKMKQMERKKVELEEKQRQRREELKRCITGIHEMQVAYNNKYVEIGEISRGCRNVSLLIEKVAKEMPKLKLMNELLLKLFHKCEEGKVVTNDLKAAEKLVQEISAISGIFSFHTDEINKSIQRQEEGEKEETKRKEQLELELRAKKQEEEQALKAKQEEEQALKAKQEEEQALKAKQAEEENKIKVQMQQQISVEKEELVNNQVQSPTKQFGGINDCVSSEDLKWYLVLKKFLEDFEEKLKPFINDHVWKKFRFDCQKAVILPVNAISPLDDLHLEDKLYKLSRLLQKAAVPLDNTLFVVTRHPLGHPFCFNYLAKKFVQQGELVVSRKPDAAFAIAAVIVALWVEFPEFGSLLLAHFHRECPYLVPAYLPQLEGQSNESYYKLLGYQFEDGKMEAEDKFLWRMTGVMRLYAAILVTPLKRTHSTAGRKHPMNIREGWRWFSATLNLPPRVDISATLIYEFLEVAGWMMHQAYGKQFSKLLAAFCYQYLPLLQKQVSPDGGNGPVVRLENFIEKIIKEHKLIPPSGLLPSNFW